MASGFAQLYASWVPSGAGVSVGCAQGVDSSIRGQFPSAQVFRAAGARPWQLAQRSRALVQHVASVGGLLVAVPAAGQHCPAGVSPGAAFVGGGSGTWASIAAAVSMGCAVLVSTSVPPAWLVSRGQQVGTWLWYVPAVRQPTLL